MYKTKYANRFYALEQKPWTQLLEAKVDMNLVFQTMKDEKQQTTRTVLHMLFQMDQNGGKAEVR